VVTLGTVSKLSVAGALSADPTELVNTAWYWFPPSPAAVVNV
jgi:hypothetical protein